MDTQKNTPKVNRFNELNRIKTRSFYLIFNCNSYFGTYKSLKNNPMRKVSLLLASFGLLLYACEKIDPTIPAQNESHYNTDDENFGGNKNPGNAANSGQIFVDGNVLCFSTIGYYESIVNFTDDSKTNGVIQFAENLDFTSYYDSRPVTDVIEDNFVGAILNPDQIVKIGEWFIRINTVSRLVYVCSDEITEAYQLVKNERHSDPNVFTFSTDDDVLEALKDLGNNGQSAGKIPCNENAAPGNNVPHHWDEYCDNYEVKFRSAYDSWGIIKKLKLEFWHNKMGGSPDQTSFSIGYKYKWKKKCKNETAEVTHALHYPPLYSWEFVDDHHQLTFYSGTHSLSKYYVGNASETGGPTVAYRNQCTGGTSSITLVNYLKHGY